MLVVGVRWVISPASTPAAQAWLDGMGIDTAGVRRHPTLRTLRAWQVLEEDGQLRAQPVFCLMRVELLESLVAFTQAGGRKIDRWTDQHRTVVVPFDLPNDDPQAFFNANTLAELHALESASPPRP